jgi:NAD+ kinase
MPAMSRPRVILLADRDRPNVAEVVDAITNGLKDHVEIVHELEADGQPLPAGLDAEFAIAIGGDGTLISQARRVVDHGLALIGVNIGRLGFLAEFDGDGLIEHAPAIFGGEPAVQEHIMLRIEVLDENGAVIHTTLAMNDGVITAGEPFRMIELSLTINGADGPQLNGDGMIVATPVGSTAYNVSAGGPIVHSSLEAITITPLAAHSLAFRPIVLGGDAEIKVRVIRANPGTKLVADGHVAMPEPLREGHCVSFRRYPKKARLVLNPATTYWRILLDKLHWAAPPTYRDDSEKSKRRNV